MITSKTLIKMNKLFAKRFIFVIPAIVWLSDSQAQTVVKPTEPGINVTFMDKSVKPNTDFFRFVNGTWLNQTEIPNDRTSWGSFNELLKKTDKDALTILKEAANNPVYKSNTDQGKAVNLFKSILDTVARNKEGIAPLKPYLAKIDKVKTIQHKFLNEIEQKQANNDTETLVCFWAVKETLYKIYGLKGIDFKKNLFIEQVDAGRVFGRIETQGVSQRFSLIKEKTDNYILVYAEKELR